VTENDPLAVLYNDESVAEQRSLFIAFDLFLSPDFTILRETILGGPVEDEGAETYRRFRKIVINLVLSTDIASPERTQVGKSKWKEAFGDTFESMERKLKQHLVDSPGGIDNDGEADEDSISETPESSEVEQDNNNKNDPAMSPSAGQSTNPVVMQNLDDLVSVASGMSGRNNNKSFRGGRRRSTHSVPCNRRASVQLLQSDEVYKAKFQRRMSTYSGANGPSPARRASGFRKRLGIRRSMDLSGESLEMYRRAGDDENMDEPDEFKAQVVMETIITAADVAHNLQGWDQMVVWSGRLYLELRKAFIEGRGGDPQTRWFENQIGFLESYLLPLARRLEDSNVFGDSVGMMFAQIVEQNRDKWLEEGSEITEAIIAKAAEIYSEETLEEERIAIAQQTRLTGRGNGLKFRGTNLAILGSM
jgi:3'5'-cyclic nucleotide phosphodiesterase